VLWETLMEELFFFQYHMHMSKRDCMTLPVHERKWIIQRFIRQKQRESEAIEKAKKGMRKK
jgi:hypothetical protein